MSSKNLNRIAKYLSDNRILNVLTDNDALQKVDKLINLLLNVEKGTRKDDNGQVFSLDKKDEKLVDEILALDKAKYPGDSVDEVIKLLKNSMERQSHESRLLTEDEMKTINEGITALETNTKQLERIPLLQKIAIRLQLLNEDGDERIKKLCELLKTLQEVKAFASGTRDRAENQGFYLFRKKLAKMTTEEQSDKCFVVRVINLLDSMMKSDLTSDQKKTISEGLTALQENTKQLERRTLLQKIATRLQSLNKDDDMKIKILCELLETVQERSAFTLRSTDEDLAKEAIEAGSDFVVKVIELLNGMMEHMEWDLTGDQKEKIKAGIEALKSYKKNLKPYQGRKRKVATSESSECSYI